ncbi:MAG TPA: SRPBCC family protein [Burkholderiales bacterium]|jgi:uncharacterized protein YndB with AHSA1/START domain
MPSYAASISIAAPRESVWRVLSAVASWPEWLPTVSSVQPLDGSPLEVGFQYTVHQPRLRPATWVVTELEPPSRFVWQARSPGLLMVAEHAVADSAPGNSHVTLRFSFEGLLGGPLGWLFRSVTEHYLSQEAASLKFKVEGRQLGL